MFKVLSAALLCALLAGALFGVGDAQQNPGAEGGVRITPIRLFLDNDQAIGDLTIRNANAEPMRFQVTGFSWQESIDGRVELTPSNDLIFYPTIFALAPGAAQVIRVGIEGSPSRAERTFRVIVTALPPPILPGQIRQTTIQISERYSVPVFVQPPGASSRVEVTGAEMRSGRLYVELSNTGTSYDLVHTIAVTGTSASGATLFTVKAQGWYVLAGGKRVFVLALPRGTCRAVRTLRIVADDEKGRVDATLPARGTCL